MSRLLAAPLLAFGIVVLSGCGGEKLPQIYEVEGIVKMKDKPMDQLRVEFWPTGPLGTKSAANTDDEGRFVLLTWDRATKGAVAGKHKVVIRDNTMMKVPFAGRENENVDTSLGAKPRIADIYTNVSKTPVEVEITGKKLDLVIEIEPYVEGPPPGVKK
jgi:hypothetical protein